MIVAATALHPADWTIVALFMAGTVAVGFYFVRRAGKDIDSFFVTGRSLPWYLAGVSLIATSFAADTPLWITSLVRQYGVHYIWQYWAPAIGASLAIVLFARLWRWLRVLTDIEFIELRYSGKAAAALRFWMGFSLAMFFCPLIIGWVAKAMEVITREAMGLPPEYRIWTTIVVVLVALASCALSGLWGVVYTDFVQFLLATAGTITLAVLAVREVGGLDAMVAQLQAMETWGGRGLSIAPNIGSREGQMSIWNGIGYLGILWIGVALSGGYQAQRLLACRNARHATYAMLLHSTVYYALVCWPWIIVALCSLILLPDLGTDVGHDAAYPRMIMQILPIGMKGILVAALLAAFMSTISTLFNWGSSYLVNDVYRRFLVPRARPPHYVLMGRLATLFMAVVGGLISFAAEDIQQLLTIAYVVSTGPAVVGALRWLWWRQTAIGDLAATVTAWVLAPLMLFPLGFGEPLFDGVVRRLFDTHRSFSSDPDLLGARMLFMLIVVTSISVTVSFLTRRTAAGHLEQFVRRARPFRVLWRPVIDRLDLPYREAETVGRTLVSWPLAFASVYGVLFGVGKVLLGSPGVGLTAMVVSGIAFWLTVRRIREDLADEDKMEEDPHELPAVAET